MSVKLEEPNQSMVVSLDHIPNLDQLATYQGVSEVSDFESLLGDFWPEDETADDFIAFIAALRGGER